MCVVSLSWYDDFVLLTPEDYLLQEAFRFGRVVKTKADELT